MKITQKQAPRFAWGKVWGLNYKDKANDVSVLYANLKEDHGEVSTSDKPRYYYILAGKGEYIIGGKKELVEPGDMVMVPPHTKFDYRPLEESLEVILFMEYWDSTKWEKEV